MHGGHQGLVPFASTAVQLGMGGDAFHMGRLARACVAAVQASQRCAFEWGRAHWGHLHEATCCASEAKELPKQQIKASDSVGPVGLREALGQRQEGQVR